jgi:ABC-2 type transport system ATP-binding protein
MHPGRTARQHLLATAAIGSVAPRRVDEVLDEVGLASAADQRAGGFSLGMRQRLALAGALLGEPEVLLLDEPSNGLDPDGIRWLRHSLRDFADRGGTVFVSSHLIAELAMFADDLVVVGAGRLLAAEPLRTTLARGDSTVVVRTPHADALARLMADHRVTLEVVGDRLSLHGTSTAAVSQIAFDHRIQVTEITETSRSLEEILIDLTGASAEFAAA